MKGWLITSAIVLVVAVGLGFFAGYKVKASSYEKRAMRYFIEGKEYYDHRQYPEAAEALNRSIGLEPSRESAHILLSSAYQNMGLTALSEKEMAAGGMPGRKQGE